MHRRNAKCQPTDENTLISLMIRECKIKQDKKDRWKLTWEKTKIQKDMCTKMFIAVLFVVVNKWKGFNFRSTGE